MNKLNQESEQKQVINLGSINPIVCPCGSKNLLLTEFKSHPVWKDSINCDLVCPQCTSSIQITIKKRKK